MNEIPTTSRVSTDRAFIFGRSIRQRQCHDCAVKKIIHVTGGRPWKTKNWLGVCPVNIFITLTRNQKAGASRDNGANVVHVYEASHLRRNICIETVANNEGAGIDEVGLTFRFAGTEIDYQAVALLKIHSRSGEIEPLVREKTEWTADEKWPVEYRVETGGMLVSRIMISACVKDRKFVAEPILVDGELERSHLRANFNTLASDAI